jgi:hypothetical protein
VTLQQLIDAVRTEGGFDVSPEQAKAWILQRYKAMVARAGWRMATVDVAMSVAGESQYTLSDDLVDVRRVLVGGTPYDLISAEEMFDLKSGRRFKTGVGGLFAPAWDADAGKFVEVYPAPDTDGEAISALAAVEPPDIETMESPDIPVDLHEYLVDGAIAVGLARIDERLPEADRFEQRFEDGVEKLRRRRNTRVGSGPQAIRRR